MLDVRRLQMLRAVHREGSISAAARSLGYTQPAISHQLARLEDEVATSLVTRSGRGVRLTDAGLALVEHADAIIARIDAAEQEVASIAGCAPGASASRRSRRPARRCSRVPSPGYGPSTLRSR